MKVPFRHLDRASWRKLESTCEHNNRRKERRDQTPEHSSYLVTTITNRLNI